MAGIPLTVAIRTIREKNDSASGHKFYAPVGKQELVPVETGQDAIEVDYFKEIEADFSQEAERILERLNLAHMRPKRAEEDFSKGSELILERLDLASVAPKGLHL